MVTDGSAWLGRPGRVREVYQPEEYPFVGVEWLGADVVAATQGVLGNRRGAISQVALLDVGGQLLQEPIRVPGDHVQVVPGGTHLAFTSGPGRAFADYGDLFETFRASVRVAPIGRTASRLLVAPREGIGFGSFDFSPDGRLLAVRAWRAEGGEALLLVNASTGRWRTLARSDRVGEPAWSPGAAMIAVGVSDLDGPDSLVVIDAVSGERRIVAGGEVLDRPAWSPAGTRIAFATREWVEGQPGPMRLRVVDVNRPDRLTDLVSAGSITDPDW
jgi:hypothetical protein